LKTNVNTKREVSGARNEPGELTRANRFERRGNAAWEAWRRRGFNCDSLALADGQSERDGHKTNSTGLRSGYDPYDSGVLARQGRRRKKDLRALSKWIELTSNSDD
jgi:hypothetical protein